MNKATVLITGASSGIGKATAILLNKKGYNVYAAARRVEMMTELEEAGIHVLSMDLTNNPSMQAGIKRIQQEAGMVDILINNAGYGSFGSLEEVPIFEVRKQINVNLIGLAKLTQLVLPAMRQAGKGAIVNISSMGGKFGEAMGCWYHATKYAVEGLSESLYLEMKPFGVKVIIIEPGIIRTEWADVALTHLSCVSGKGPYKKAAEKTSKLFTKIYEPKLSSQPQVVAKTICKAIRAKNPRLRYATGKGAKLSAFLRRFLCDSVYFWLFEKVTNKLTEDKKSVSK